MEDILNQLQHWYEEAKNSYDEWDRIAHIPHENYEHEGIRINRAKAEGEMQAYQRILEVIEKE